MSTNILGKATVVPVNPGQKQYLAFELNEGISALVPLKS